MNLKQIIDNVLIYLGEETGDYYFGNIDTALSKLPIYANSSVADYIKVHDWSFLKRKATISIIDGTTLYDLPDDFDRFINDTNWVNGVMIKNPSNDRSVSYAGQYSDNFEYKGRLYGGQIEYINTPTGNITFEYISKFAIKSETGVLKERFESDTDEWLLDSELLSRLTRQRYSSQVGEIDQSIAADINNRLKKLILSDIGARILNTGNTRQYDLHEPYYPKTH